MDINNLNKVNELREKLVENAENGARLMSTGVTVFAADKELDIPDALAQAIEDLVTAHFVREGQDILDELNSLGVNVSMGLIDPRGAEATPSREAFESIFGGASNAKPSPHAIRVSSAELAKMFGPDVASLLGALAGGANRNRN